MQILPLLEESDEDDMPFLASNAVETEIKTLSYLWNVREKKPECMISTCVSIKPSSKIVKVMASG